MTKRKPRIFLYIFIIAVICFAVSVAAAACASDGSGASQTNNQTAGIDESDIVKVTADGYIFKAQSDGLTVSKADNGNVEVVLKEAYHEFVPCEMFVTGSALILLGDKKVPIADTSAKMTKSEVRIYDLKALKKSGTGYMLRTSEFYGSFYTARLLDNQMYIIFRLGYNEYFGETDVNYFYDTYQGIKKFDNIDDLSDEEATTYKGFIVAKYNLNNAKSNSITAKFYSGDNISDLYCSPYAIYAISSYEYEISKGSGGCGLKGMEQKSQITKISLDDLTLINQLDYRGSILSRYSLYDNGLVFYMAGTESFYHCVYAYDQDMQLLGQSKGFAYGEEIYSVMFQEGLCYVVTFRQIDPLFKIDISNPTDIKILGELKIEGYSTHLQAFGDYVIGLGFETNSFAQTTGLKLTLFGVEGDEPVEVNSILFRVKYGKESSSEATYNPKAILCEPNNNIFAFPVQYKTEFSKPRQGAIIFGVIDGELKELAFLTIYEENAASFDLSKNVTRITRIGDYLYTIADGYIASYSLSDFSQIGIFDTRINAEN